MKTANVRRSKTAVSPVIGTILMVAITVVLAAVLYVMVGQLTVGPPTNNPTLILQPLSWSAGNISVNVQSVTNAPNLNPTDLTYTIVSSSGVGHYTGAAGQTIATGATNVTLTYQDLTDASKVSAGDSIRISVTPAQPNALAGATIRVFFQSNQISTATLP